MSKKIIAAVMIALAAMSFAFAGRGDIGVGANIGFGVDAFGFNQDTVGMAMGVYFSGSLEYGIARNVDFKGEVGFNSLSTLAVSNGKETKTSDSGRTPGCAIYAGVVYNFPAFGNDDMFEIGLGAGADALLSYVTKSNFNAAIGLGLEMNFKFNLSRDLALTANSRFGLPLVNTNENYSKGIKDEGWVNFTVKNTFGVVYTL